jgi:hypothetical protein
MIYNVNWRPLGVKTIDDNDNEYTGIDTMEGSFPMRQWVLKSWIHPSGVTVIGITVSVGVDRIGEGACHHINNLA